MAKYTVTLGELVEKNVEIFNFNYPFFNEEYRQSFEQHFINNFYYDEIGCYPIAKFISRLENRLNKIMPYWNKIIMTDNLEQRILDNYDVTETFERDSENNATSTSNGNNRQLFSDLPKQRVDFESDGFVTTLTKDIGENTNIASGGSKEKWTRKMQGNIGVQTDADAIKKYWETVRKIEEEIFNDLECLFMEVY